MGVRALSAPRRLMVKRRRRPILPAAVGLTALLILPAIAGADDAPAAFDGPRLTADGLIQPAGAGDEALLDSVRASTDRSPAMAMVNGLWLVLPAEDAVLVGYHEASYQDALPLEPVGVLRSNDNTTKFTAPADDLGGAGYRVMSSRGRRNGATTAVDILLRPGVEVLSPIDGIVEVVRDYSLYGRYADSRIEIRPTAAPHLRIVLIHVDGTRVRPGQRVVAGVTVLADQANHFGFPSQIDRFTEPDRFGHVHLEVKG